MDRLIEILNSMDIPDNRKPDGINFDLNWLIRNIQCRNSEHPNIKEAIKLIKSEIRKSYNKEWSRNESTQIQNYIL